MNNIAIFASGSGTNAQTIAEYFQKTGKKNIRLILSNKSDAYVLKRSEKLKIPAIVFNREQFYHTSYVVDILNKYSINWIVLAGFLWLIPDNILKLFPNKIVNIHPALLPKYGGAGMYGNKVHEAVVANKEKESGITIHYVNDKYDQGTIIFQAKCSISPNDSPEDVAAKVHTLEYKYYPVIIEKLVEGNTVP
jgi:phosphoribosylglycinamide formyltransferase-1